MTDWKLVDSVKTVVSMKTVGTMKTVDNIKRMKTFTQSKLSIRHYLIHNRWDTKEVKLFPG